MHKNKELLYLFYIDNSENALETGMKHSWREKINKPFLLSTARCVLLGV